MPDGVIARKVGAAVGVIFAFRKELGIPAYVADSDDDPVKIAASPLLGTATDQEVADLTGLTLWEVSGMRVRRGIPPFTKRPDPSWRLAARPLLGIKPDTELAARFGVSETAIYKLRQKHGIPACPRG
jgi:hypothetical protein